MTRRLPAALLALGASLAIQACDPCSGIVGCTGTARLSLDGRLIVRETGVAVPGAVLAFVRTGGVPLASDSVRTVTDHQGRFQLSVAAGATGVVMGDLVVVPPAPWHAYHARGLQFRTSPIRGEGQILGRVVVTPYLEFIGDLYSRSTGQPLAGARVTIRRTGGVALSSDSIDVTAGGDGRIYFKLDAADAGDMVADVVVEAPTVGRTFRRDGVHFTATYVDQIPAVGAVWSFGAGLPYVGEIYARGSGIRPAGIDVEFRRTGGIPTDPDSFVVATNADGRFPFLLTPEADGEVVGDLVIRPPAPQVPETIPALRMSTADTDQLILLGVWGFGPSLQYVGEFRRLDTDAPVVDAAVAFQRTDGIQVTPSLLTARTGPDGRFLLNPDPATDGEVVGNLTIHPAAPLHDTTITGVRLQTFRADGLRLAGVWRIAP